MFESQTLGPRDEVASATAAEEAALLNHVFSGVSALVPLVFSSQLRYSGTGGVWCVVAISTGVFCLLVPSRFKQCCGATVGTVGISSG